MRFPLPLLKLCLLVSLPALAVAGLTARQQPPAANVLFVTLDGMRWQEVFGGLSSELMTKDGGGISEDDAPALQKEFGGPTAEVRREKLMPFLWGTVARQGQIFGDASRNSIARVTNGLRFSYPGYNEMLTGFPDPAVKSNDPIANPNVTVLEWLNRRPKFAGKVAGFSSWALLPWILNEKRSGIPSNAAGPPIVNPRSDRERAINEFAADLPAYWGEERFDAATGLGALEYVRRNRPKVFYVMLGETDEWAHGRRYDLYLDAARRNDRFIRQLWETAQSLPEYAGKTALVIATDHGRGETAVTWTGHGEKVLESDRIWMAVMGPGVQPLGVRSGVNATQSQIAATVASLVGEDYQAAQPKAAPPLALGK
ncbi:MAG TPA: alkaline phosphatase family protein [Vicinamibacterales bacterium]|nr:alkaline phosphatase family protein [Vicinamibacterales bacterium]